MIGGVLLSATAVCKTPDETKQNNTRLEEVQIWGDKNSNQTLYIAPTSRVSAAQMKSINLTTIEDAVVYEPGLIIRNPSQRVSGKGVNWAGDPQCTA